MIFEMNSSTIVLMLTLTFVFSYFLLIITETNNDRAYKRLSKLIKITKVKKKKKTENEGIFEKLMAILEKRFSKFVVEQIKKGRLGSLEFKLKQAGLYDTTTNQFWTRAIIYGVLASFVGVLTGKPLFILVFFGLGVYYPFRNLNSLIEKRQFILLNELPDFLDLVSVTFPATSGIEETFELVTSRMEGEVSKEFAIAVNEIKVGRRKREVFQDLVLRTGIKDISTLISQINQSETFGVGLEEVLVAQAKTIRHSKKVVAEKRGNNASSLMYLPAAFMLIVAIGVIIFPFAIQFIENISAFQ